MSRRNILLLCLIILFLAVLCFRLFKKETFISNDENSGVGIFDKTGIEKNRTLLYGSIFLDGLDNQIKNLTDPKIMYDTKRIDIIRYSDVLQNST